MVPIMISQTTLNNSLLWPYKAFIYKYPYIKENMNFS